MSTRRTTTIVRTASLSVASKNQSDDDLLTDIFTAYFSARQNKRNTYSQVNFERNLSDNLIRLYQDIRDRKYKVGRSMCFIIKDPVVREVFAASFRDRIVHHLLYNWLMPLFERIFIYDSYSCRVGKGTLFGVVRLEHHIRSCSDNYRKDCYVLKMDIEGYFMNIDRRILFEKVTSSLIRLKALGRAHFDIDLALYLLRLVIFNDPVKGCFRKGRVSDWNNLSPTKSLFNSPEGCGLPIGNLTSQLFSNIYLSALDEYVKRALGCRHYGRYVDDFYIVGTSSSDLMKLVPLIRSFLEKELSLTLHPRKIRLLSVYKGVPFLGAILKPYQRYVSHRTKRKIRCELPQILCEEYNPYRSQAVYQSYAGYLKSLSHARKSSLISVMNGNSI